MEGLSSVIVDTVKRIKDIFKKEKKEPEELKATWEGEKDLSFPKERHQLSNIKDTRHFLSQLKDSYEIIENNVSVLNLFKTVITKPEDLLEDHSTQLTEILEKHKLNKQTAFSSSYKPSHPKVKTIDKHSDKDFVYSFTAEQCNQALDMLDKIMDHAIKEFPMEHWDESLWTREILHHSDESAAYVRIVEHNLTYIKSELDNFYTSTRWVWDLYRDFKRNF